MLRKNHFFDFFPPPAFLSMPAVGLDISDRSVRFVEILRKRGQFIVGRYGEEKIPEGVIFGGVIQKSEELKKVLQQIQKKYKLSFVRVSLPEQKGYLIKMQVPRMRKNELRESIQLQLENYVPIKPENAIFDYTLVDHEDAKRRKNDDVGVAVMPKDVVFEYSNIFKGTNLTPLSFELEAHAVARAVIPKGDRGTYFIVDIGATRTGFSIVSEGIVRFTSTADVGGDLLTESVMKTYNLTKEKAQEKKEKEGLTKGEERKNMYSILIPIASILREEISKQLIYWNTQRVAGEFEGEKIDNIILCGGEANVPGLKNYLSASLKTPIRLANPWVNITSFDDYIPKIPYNHSLRYVTALGLSLRSHNQ